MVKTGKKHVFWPLDGVEITRKRRILIRSVQLPLFRHLNQNSTHSGNETVTGYVYWVKVDRIYWVKVDRTQFSTISPPEEVQRRVRGQNRGFWAWRVHF